jgi:hypothetical protein
MILGAERADLRRQSTAPVPVRGKLCSGVEEFTPTESLAHARWAGLLLSGAGLVSAARVRRRSEPWRPCK